MQSRCTKRCSHISRCFCSVTLSCSILSDPMDCSTPGFPVFHYLLQFAQTHVHCINDATQLSRPLSPPSPRAFSLLPESGSFPMSWLFVLCGQSIGASVSASVIPMNIQDWFPLGLTGLISLQSKGLSRVISSTTIQKHQFFGTQLSLWSSSHDYWKNHSSH